ncbi:MAG TPA: hypothetical protein VJ063_17390 [Verrucomicrobiae bacterium]|nr:hypothetical protein [Verrucomicrobiae bacterium]
MRIVVQNPRTGCYLEETGGWTTDVRHARDFVSSADAMSARRQHGLPEASLVFRFEREGYSISVPLDALPREAAEVTLRPHSPVHEDAGLLIG